MTYTGFNSYLEWPFSFKVLTSEISFCPKSKCKSCPHHRKARILWAYPCLKSWISKVYLRLRSDYLIPSKEVITLFPKAVPCYNFKSVCLHYDDKNVHKPSFLTFSTLHTKKTNFIKSAVIFYSCWWYWKSIIFDIWNSELVPSSFCPSNIGYWWKYLQPTSIRKVKCDGN